MAVSKSVKLFNLEDRKSQNGSITEVDIFQWKNTLLDNLKREADFADHCREDSRWGVEKDENRGFVEPDPADGSAKKKADQVTSMLTKIASYSPRTIVREITRRTKCLADVWNIARDWAGIQSSGSKHFDYYKVKMSYRKVDKEETKQEFFYRLRDAMEDTLVLSSDNMKDDDGQLIAVDEDMTPTVKSLVVVDWLDAIAGPPLVEHVHRVYAKELETVTLSSLQSRIWKNMDSLLREIETAEEDPGRAYQAAAAEARVRQVGDYRRGGNNGRRIQNQRSPRQFNQRSRGRGGRGGNFVKASTKSDKECKLCKAAGSPNFKSHEIAECWLLDDKDRSGISKSHARAQAIFGTEVHTEIVEYDEDDNDYEDDENYEEEEDVNYD